MNYINIKSLVICAFMLISFFLLMPTTDVHAIVSLPDVFSDNMVLQRKMPVAIFGTGSVSQQVSVQFNGQNKRVNVGADGKWQLNLDPMRAGGPYELVVSDSDNTIHYQNVMVGEVFLMSGQSNMQYPIQDLYENDISKNGSYDNFPNIGVSYSDPDTGVTTPWYATTSTSSIKNTSALSYFYAKSLYLATGVPVGLIVRCKVGSNIEMWLDPNSIAELNVTAANCGIYYNNLISRVIPFTIRGVVWDQGEANIYSADYRLLLSTMMKNWRKNWGADVYFLVDQMPRNGSETYTDPVPEGKDKYTKVRQAEFDILAEKNTALVTTWDISDGALHPKNKVEKGYRLSLIARALFFYENIEYMGPTYYKSFVENDKIVLYFLHAKDGLMFANGETTLKGMAIAGENNVWYWANGQIDGNRLVLSNPNIPHPTQARYIWGDGIIEGNLLNKAGLPCPTFRSDTQFHPYEYDHALDKVDINTQLFDSLEVIGVQADSGAVKSIKIAKDRALSGSVSFIVSVYRNGMIKDLKNVYCNLDNVIDMVDLNNSQLNVETGDIIKVFAWNSVSMLKPYTYMYKTVVTMPPSPTPIPPRDLSYNIDVNKSEVNVSILSSANKMISVLVLDSSGDISYLSQLKSDSRGECSAIFKLSSAGTYTVKVGIEDSPQAIVKSFNFDGSPP